MIQQIIVPIALFAVPVLITWIVFRFANNRNNKNAEIIIKAIETNSDIDVNKLVLALGNREKTPSYLLQLRLLRGCIFTFLGIAAAVLNVLFVNNISNPNIVFSIQFLFLTAAGVFLSIGVAYLSVYFATRKSVQDEKKQDK